MLQRLLTTSKPMPKVYLSAHDIRAMCGVSMSGAPLVIAGELPLYSIPQIRRALIASYKNGALDNQTAAVMEKHLQAIERWKHR